MRFLLSFGIAIALTEFAHADSLAPTTAGTFPDLTFPNAVIRSYKNDVSVPMLVDANLRFSPDTESGAIEPGYVIQVDFDVPVHDVTVWYFTSPFTLYSSLIEVQGIDEFGQVVSSALADPDDRIPVAVPLPLTFNGHNVRTVLIHSIGSLLLLSRIDFESNQLIPGETIVSTNIAAGSYRDAFVMGCKGRTLELTAESLDSGAAVRFLVGPADDLSGDHTKSQDAKVGKLRKFPLDEPKVYRVRMQNVGPTDVSLLEVETGESFTSAYDKSKFVVDAISTLTTADALFGALPDTEIDISVKTIGNFPSPVDLELLEGPALYTEADLSNLLSATDTGVACSGVPIRKGGLLRLRCANLGNTTNKLQVLVKRTRPIPGLGVLEL